jgi:hypothetical protein
MNLSEKGFDLTFTVPMDKAIVSSPKSYAIKSYAYKYHQGYGSPQVGVKNLKANQVSLLEDGKTVKLVLSDMQDRQLYEISLKALKTAKGEPLANNLIVYHAHNLLR